MKIVSNHILTEAVDGRNLGAVNQCLLLLQMLIFRFRLQALLQSQTHPFPHLRGSRFRKGHHKKPVHIQGRLIFPLAADQRKNPLHQNRRLTGTGCSRDQHIFISHIDDFFLFLGPSDAHCSSSSIRFQISSSPKMGSLRLWKPPVLLSSPQTPL